VQGFSLRPSCGGTNVPDNASLLGLQMMTTLVQSFYLPVMQVIVIVGSARLLAGWGGGEGLLRSLRRLHKTILNHHRGGCALDASIAYFLAVSLTRSIQSAPAETVRPGIFGLPSGTRWILSSDIAAIRSNPGSDEEGFEVSARLIWS
jgi:hypothetical protein